MYDPSTRLRSVNRLLTIAIVLALMGLGYAVLSALNTKRVTGILTLSADSPSGVLSISRADGAAQVLGIGTATVRLKPGDYVVASWDNGSHGTKVVHISRGKTTRAQVSAAQSSVSAPIDNTPGFINFDVLDNNGLSSAQSSTLEQLFQYWKPDGKLFTIDPDSIAPVGHDPNSNDPFVINFSGTADSTPYKATVSYFDTENISLTVFDPQSGQQLYPLPPPTDSQTGDE